MGGFVDELDSDFEFDINSEQESPKIKFSSPKIQVLGPKIQVLSPKIQVLGPKIQVLGPKIQVALFFFSYSDRPWGVV